MQKTMHRALYSVAQIREIEDRAAATLDGAPGAPASFGLMEKAAQSLADWLAARLRPGECVLFLAGPGNNGGDALLAAALLARQSFPGLALGEHASLLRKDAIDVWFAPDPQELPGNAALAHAALLREGIAPTQPRLDEPQPTYAWIVDGLFGIGLKRAPQGVHAEWIRWANAQCETGASRLLAIDVPSGLDADTGAAMEPAIRATWTLTMIGGKPGLHTAQGRDFAGAVDVAPLDIARTLYPAPVALLSDADEFSALLPRRLHASHKGSHGKLLILGGASGMSGAAILVARSALLCGAGRVIVGLLDEDAGAFDPQHPELMLRRGKAAVLAAVVGPGMGAGGDTGALLKAVLSLSCACVLDADALNLVAATPALRERLRERGGRGLSTVITPHPLEAARLLSAPREATETQADAGTGVHGLAQTPIPASEKAGRPDAADVQADRLEAVSRLARDLDACAVLKGSGTIVHPSARTAGMPHAALPRINPTGNGALATADTGDVLAGCIGALLAQGMPEFAAACAAVWIHGSAADRLSSVEEDESIGGPIGGPIGLCASDLPPAMRRTLNTLAPVRMTHSPASSPFA
ncbi:MAG: bifunctional ADP-dependent NAD(P)H-hydrate dehydratase/NAD(P)H-hydrate epimerase [Candidatus Protistobacter heckmanni]|nr:bifunctional ADP-dependent NAD(P)H-hydrate dehydratase/NAD(P)H-hydrate epimerase [Candidatus Protistobacter heckmanni]